jgi:CheY-like chemotaxis protein
MLEPHASAAHLRGPIVIADDNIDDVFFLRRKLKELDVNAPIIVLRDGHETIEYLKQVCLDNRVDLFPEIIFLDLKMPRATGFSVLCWLREQESFQGLKVVILSDSDDPGDVALAIDLNADAYMAKQPNLADLADTLRKFAPAVLHPAPLMATSAA